MKSMFKKLRDGYVRFVEKQGFPIIVTVCVAVITATALWTGQREETWTAPTPPVISGDISAAQLMQQSLREAATATPAPTAAPRAWIQPMETFTVLRGFSMEELVQSGVTGLWAIHDAVDLQAEAGSKVFAMSDGTVTADGHDKLMGAWVLIDHSDGVEALYAGMAMGGAFIKGDDVRSGDVIGFTGTGPLDESDLPPHLHLRVTQDGQAIDPAMLWR